MVHSLSQHRAEGHRRQSPRLFPHSSDLQEGSECCGEEEQVRLSTIIQFNRIKNSPSVSYAACRWDSCWPGNAGCLRMSCTDTDVCRAG